MDEACIADVRMLEVQTGEVIAVLEEGQFPILQHLYSVQIYPRQLKRLGGQLIFPSERLILSVQTDRSAQELHILGSPAVMVEFPESRILIDSHPDGNLASSCQRELVRIEYEPIITLDANLVPPGGKGAVTGAV